jgi:DNA-directed RNA polymerase subunit RPC12/RpoP
MVKRILSEGRPFVINGAPFTRTMLDQKFMAFTETGSITNCRLMLLHSPVALGDSLTERVPEDAYKDMLLALDLGCLYSWYDDRIYPTHKTLTEYMFPFTPIELHEGYVIGKERILTDRSGLFGWADQSEFTAHVFDRSGKETDEVKVQKVMRDGATFAEVRIPEGYSVALVRVQGMPEGAARLPEGLASQIVKKIDYQTFEVISLPLGTWVGLHYGKHNLYKNPKTGKPTMVDIIKCYPCGQEIPEMPLTEELAEKGPEAVSQAMTDYRCPKCGMSPYRRE